MSKKKIIDGHWLDKVEPKWWKARNVWRVRAMRKGTKHQWTLEQGKGDPGSTGRLLAMAEWNRERLKIIKGEEPEYDESGLFINFRSPQEEFEHYQLYQDRADWEESGLAAKMTFEEWREWRDYQQLKADMRQKAVEDTSGLPMKLPETTVERPLTDLTAVFLAHLEHRLKNTKPGLKTDEDLSKSRFTQYQIALAHLDKLEGTTPIMPVGKFRIGEEQLAQLLARYRQKCKDEMTKAGHSGWWFNERMKTARMFVELLANERLLSSKPPNLAKLVKKYKIEENPLPIPLPILRAIWGEANAKFRGFTLLALNCGFRQTEIFNLNRTHIKVLARRTCVSKYRGKTGVELAIPLWDSTQRFIAKYAEADGPLFPWESNDDAIEALYYEFKKCREKVGKTVKAALDFSFENLRDTGASFMGSINPMLTPFYLGQKEAGQVKRYVAPIQDEQGQVIIPMNLDSVLLEFEKYLGLPTYEP